ncbi:MAG: aldehyde dehydrogenase [Phycisphaerales bacterium]|nr:MAG: aldehyde dehydrogenase [Phycisphaerales bacterium]
MIHIPVLRHGRPYESVDKTVLMHHATGEPIAQMSLANSGLIGRDIGRMNDRVLERFSVADLLAMCRGAAELFSTATLPVGGPESGAVQSFDDYIHQLSATTGMPVAYCRTNAGKIHKVLAEMDSVLLGLTRGFDLSILDRGYGANRGATLSFFRRGRIFGAVLPSNSPGVHSLWLPAIPLKAPIVLKPGREEPWTPLRVIEAFVAAGVPREAFGFYPTDHAGANEILRRVDRSMLFGSAETTRAWVNDPTVELHGPGFSKVILGDDTADEWEQYLDVIVSSIEANGGRSCINASAVWTPRHGRAIADAVAKRLAKRQALPAHDPDATLAAFANPAVADGISAAIDHGLRGDGALDLTMQHRGSPRLVHLGSVAYLLPTIVWCEDREHPLAHREFLFPYASVIECPTSEMPRAIGSTLIVSAITRDEAFIGALMAAANIDRLNIGAIPTHRISWDQPHEGNLFEHLYRQRAFQRE